MQVALVGYCAAGPFVGLTGTLAALFGALFVWGAFQGTLDVAMNTQAIAVEQLAGGYSCPGCTAAGASARSPAPASAPWPSAPESPSPPNCSSSASLALLGAGLLTTRMLPDAAEAQQRAAARPHQARNRNPNRRTGIAVVRSGMVAGMLTLAVIAFASMLCEGATANWASVYLSGPLRTTGVVPGLAYAAFALAMVDRPALGQPVADPVSPRPASPRHSPLVATIGFTPPGC